MTDQDCRYIEDESKVNKLINMILDNDKESSNSQVKAKLKNIIETVTVTDIRQSTQLDQKSSQKGIDTSFKFNIVQDFINDLSGNNIPNGKLKYQNYS